MTESSQGPVMGLRSAEEAALAWQSFLQSPEGRLAIETIERLDEPKHVSQETLMIEFSPNPYRGCTFDFEGHFRDY